MARSCMNIEYDTAETIELKRKFHLLPARQSDNIGFSSHDSGFPVSAAGHGFASRPR